MGVVRCCDHSKQVSPFILEGPKDQKLPAEMRIKVRSVTDKSLGWVSKGFLRKWNPTYTVRVATPLQETSAVTEETKLVVELAKGDKVQYLEGPLQREI